MKYLSLIILGFLLATLQPAMADETEDPTGVVALLCKMPSQGRVLSQTLSVDYDGKMVNGIPAHFSPSTISWASANGSKTDHHELNRITGAYYSWTDNETSTDPMSAYTCEKAPKKF